MATIRNETQHPINKKNAHDLYSKYMALALDTRVKGDRDLFEAYYQRAEHYLRLMNELKDAMSQTTASLAKPSQQRQLRSLNRTSPIPTFQPLNRKAS